MGRSDPALNYLKQYGYSVVRLPRADLPPGSLLERDGGDLVDLGGLESVFQAGDTAAPKVHPNERVVDMSGHIKTTLSLGLGLSLLGQFLKGVGRHDGRPGRRVQAGEDADVRVRRSLFRLDRAGGPGKVPGASGRGSPVRERASPAGRGQGLRGDPHAEGEAVPARGQERAPGRRQGQRAGDQRHRRGRREDRYVAGEQLESSASRARSCSCSVSRRCGCST